MERIKGSEIGIKVPSVLLESNKNENYFCHFRL